MTCVPIKDGIVCVPRVLTVTDRNGKVWTYEHDGWFGPIVINKDGRVAMRQPGPKSPFWEALEKAPREGK